MGKNRWNAGTGNRYNEKPLGTQGVNENYWHDHSRWSPLEKHFPFVPLVFQFNQNAFSEIFSKISAQAIKS
jgi:hypothetical protein